MQIYDKIISDIKDAMLSKNTTKRDCLRSVVSEIKNQTVNAGNQLTDEICLKVLHKSAKQRKDSIANFRSGNREDLAAKESEELRYIENYLPKMLDESATRDIIDTILIRDNIKLEKKSIGLVMKQLPKEVDRSIASRILQKMLSENI